MLVADAKTLRAIGENALQTFAFFFEVYCNCRHQLLRIGMRLSYYPSSYGIATIPVDILMASVRMHRQKINKIRRTYRSKEAISFIGVLYACYSVCK